METIHVPGPPKQAFNKNRRISDLIRAQVNHLKHVEATLPAALRSGIPQHEITTEDDAARYIAAMTPLLHAQAAAAAAQAAAATKTPIPIRRNQGLAIAAGADTAPQNNKSAAGKISSS